MLIAAFTVGTSMMAKYDLDTNSLTIRISNTPSDKNWSAMRKECRKVVVIAKDGKHVIKKVKGSYEGQYFAKQSM